MSKQSNNRPEKWAWLAGHEGFHKVSTLGRIKSVSRRIKTKSGQIRKYKGRLLKPWPDHYGYYRVNISKGGRRRTVSIARAVLETFIGPCPPGKESCHKDGKKKNNQVTNLYWGTDAENGKDYSNHRKKLYSKKSIKQLANKSLASEVPIDKLIKKLGLSKKRILICARKFRIKSFFTALHKQKEERRRGERIYSLRGDAHHCCKVPQREIERLRKLWTNKYQLLPGGISKLARRTKYKYSYVRDVIRGRIRA